jgi:hypothetical protein
MNDKTGNLGPLQKGNSDVRQRRARNLTIGLITAIVAMLPFGVRADAIIVSRAMKASTIAEVFVEPGMVRTELEIGLADLRAFRNLLPDELYLKLGYASKPRAERFREFLENDWVLNADGRQLQGRITRAEPRKRVARDEITGEPLPIQPDNTPLSVLVTLEHVLPDEPSALSLRPPMDGSGLAAASVGFVVYHAGVAVNDFRYLGTEETVDLDWEDPWYSEFRNRNLWRRYKAAMNGFVYVDGFEVRKEIIVRPKDLEKWVDLGLNGKQTISVADQAELKSKVAKFLSKHHPVTIDGKSANMWLDRIHFVRRTLRQIGVVDPPEDLSVLSATLGVIFVQPVDKLPQEVTMHWDLFTNRIQKVSAVASDESAGLPWLLTPDDPVLSWRNFLIDYRPPAIDAVPVGADHKLSLPLPALALLSLSIAAGGLAINPWLLSRKTWVGVAAAGVLGAGLLSSVAVFEIDNPFAGPPDHEGATKIVAQLAGNLHNAVQLREESRLQEAIALSVSQQQLGEVLPEVRRALAIEIQGGGSARVDRIDDVVVKDVESLDGGGFRALAEWHADASAGHWGHLHQRRMRFSALMEIKPMDDAWKLVGLTVVNVRQES